MGFWEAGAWGVGAEGRDGQARPEAVAVSPPEEVMLAEEDKNAEEKSPLDGRSLLVALPPSGGEARTVRGGAGSCLPGQALTCRHVHTRLAEPFPGGPVMVSVRSCEPCAVGRSGPTPHSHAHGVSAWASRAPVLTAQLSSQAGASQGSGGEPQWLGPAATSQCLVAAGLALLYWPTKT